MEKLANIQLHRLKLARSRALNQNPVSLPTVAELNMEIQRIEDLGRKPQALDPVTKAYVETILGQNRGRDRAGNPLFHK